MTIAEAAYDNEQELHDWVSENIHVFLPNSVCIPGCKVTTLTGKGGVPDGFAFNFQDREWFVIESELIKHGVWTHIAEQIMRFVVAMQNPLSRRKVLDRLFDHLLETSAIVSTADTLGTTTERLLQQIELFIEGVAELLSNPVDES
jgi:hypothetical protein